ncbi:MAG: hypothetical protein KDD55_01215 [Bdellovibrionales bacterium]|nr:hypothetical protein [Bdellovibrionales bacterium]
MVNPISGSGVSQLQELPTDIRDPRVKELLRSAGSTDAAVVSDLSSTSGLYKVEKHLDDYEKGKGYLSSDIAKGLKNLKIESATNLAQIDPKAFTNYTVLLGTFNYSQRARFIQGADKGIETALKIRNLHEIA